MTGGNEEEREGGGGGESKEGGKPQKETKDEKGRDIVEK